MAVLTLSCLLSENMKGAESQFQSSDSHHIAKCHHSASVLMLQLARVKYCINWQHFHFVSLYCKCNPVSYLSLPPQKQPWSLLHRLGESVSQNGKGFRGSRGPWPEWAGPISEVCFPSTTIISKGSFSHSLKPLYSSLPSFLSIRALHGHERQSVHRHWKEIAEDGSMSRSSCGAHVHAIAIKGQNSEAGRLIGRELLSPTAVSQGKKFISGPELWSATAKLRMLLRWGHSH